jgi:exosome complex component RRP4
LPIFVENRQIVIPGQFLAGGPYKNGENTYRDGDGVYASQIGFVNLGRKSIDVVSIKGRYLPKAGDPVIGVVVELNLSGWLININAPYTALLFASEALNTPFNPKRDELSKIFDIGDVLLAKILLFNRTRDPILTVKEPGLGKINRGRIFELTPTKIPRLIGRKGSMINLIKQKTSCSIIVGQNGLILINGKDSSEEELAVSAIQMIEKEAHTQGLTDRINELLDRKKEVESVVDRKEASN